MNLILTEGELLTISREWRDGLKPDPNSAWGRRIIYSAIAQAQARHMARECMDWWEGEADCYNHNQRKHFEAWLKSKGVLDG